MTEAIPLSLYVHLPWCVRKCPYCDFHSLPGGDRVLPEKAYVRSLLDDLASMADVLAGRPLQSVFFGGGTPSLFSATAIGDILAGAARIGAFAPDCEISLEANPGTAEAGRFRGFRDAGVNRLSLGVQSLQDRHLARLGRIHTALDAQRAVELAAGTGFRSFNIDLMYGLPEQTVDEARADMAWVLGAGAAHVSLYELTIEPNTAFAQAPPPLPADPVRAAIEACVQDMAASAGFRRYEISAYAQDGFRCRHNLNYWRFGDYIGIGSGAHGKVSGATGVWRETRTRDVRAYLRDPHHQRTRHRVDGDELWWEFLLNGLRLTEGFCLADFHAVTGLSKTGLVERLQPAAREGLIDLSGDRIRATARGLCFLDSILAPLMPDTFATN
ncbi:MAG: radical SAM family heme chaperone HemW [Gammaproteobacteria bacterium]|nr:radical SAM family heme chaperone HemW [Gammaproteobacteria bacterium]